MLFLIVVLYSDATFVDYKYLLLLESINQSINLI